VFVLYHCIFVYMLSVGYHLSSNSFNDHVGTAYLCWNLTSHDVVRIIAALKNACRWQICFTFPSWHNDLLHLIWLLSELFL